LDVLRQVPVLWIWDNVEPVAGFPAGTPSDWSAAEQQALRDFLSEARGTKAKFLLTSRRDEQAWLGEMPRRVAVPRMPMQERLQLAGAIAEHRGWRLADLPDLTPLLRFTQGNPLTILVTVGEALRAGIDSNERLEAFVAGLRAGEANFEDEEAEGRTKSLGASLSYGFASTFSDEERRRLALLHLFQGFVDVDVLRWMGDPQVDWALDEVRGLTRDQGIGLLDRAAEIGLLIAHGGGYYGVHPALPWYFRDLFARHFAGDEAQRARLAFVKAMGVLGDYYHRQYNEGNRQVLHALMAEEDNLLAAWRLARQHGWWGGVASAMQGLQMLYGETGRGPAWRRLVEAVTPDFVDLQSDGPLAGREEEWGLITEYRVHLAREERDLDKAARLQRICVDWDRERAREALATAAEQRNDLQRNDVRTLATSVHALGEIQRENNDPASAESYREAFGLSQSIAERAGQSICAFNLGKAYMDTAALRDFDAAERWLKQSLDLGPPGDASGSAGTLAELGRLSLQRHGDALAAKRSENECLRLINEAAQYYQQALHLYPQTAIVERGVCHNSLGVIFAKAGDLDRALQHYQQNIRYSEQAGDIFGAGQTRYNVALALLQAARFDDARAYARAALANFQSFGDRAAEYTRRAERLLATIDQAEAKQRANHERRPDQPPRPRRAAARSRRGEAARDRRRRSRRGAGARRAADQDERRRLVAVRR
jgi:tetratricopeptide (TPR) repeat protein